MPVQWASCLTASRFCILPACSVRGRSWSLWRKKEFDFIGVFLFDWFLFFVSHPPGCDVAIKSLDDQQSNLNTYCPCRIHGETAMRESFSSAMLLPFTASPAPPPLHSHFLLEHKRNKFLLLMEVSSEPQAWRNRICPCWQFKVKLLYVLTGI